MPPPRKSSCPPPKRPSQIEQVRSIVSQAEKDPQCLLLDVQEDWRNEWQGMPSFEKSEQRPHRSLIVHFANADDVIKFATLVGCKVTGETRYLWWPEIKLKRVSKLRCDG